MLSQDDQVKAGTDHYIDDIWINERVVVAERVKELLQRYGLVAKEPKSLENTCMLGLRVQEDKEGQLVWYRDGVVPVLSSERELFSVCGKLVGHYPMAGWHAVLSRGRQLLSHGMTLFCNQASQQDTIGERATGRVAL